MQSFHIVNAVASRLFRNLTWHLRRHAHSLLLAVLRECKRECVRGLEREKERERVLVCERERGRERERDRERERERESESQRL